MYVMQGRMIRSAGWPGFPSVAGQLERPPAAGESGAKLPSLCLDRDFLSAEWELDCFAKAPMARETPGAD